MGQALEITGRRGVLRALLLVGFLVFGVPAPAQDASQFHEQAAQSLSRGEVRAAILDLKNALRLEPGYLPARVLLGEAYLKLGISTAAEKELLEARQGGATRRLVVVPLSRAYLLQGKYEELLAEAIPDRRDPELDGMLHLLRGKARFQLQELDEASNEFLEAATLRPQDGSPLAGLAMVELMRARPAEALEYAERAVSLAPDDEQTWFALGSVHLRSGALEPAEKAFARVLELSAGHIAARTARAAIALDTDRPQLALEEAEHVLGIDPTDLQAAYYRALALSRLGAHADAEAALENALQILRNSSTAFRNQDPVSLLIAARLELGAGNREQAVTHLSRLVALAPDHVVASKLLATLSIELGDPLRATRLLEKVAPFAPRDADVRELLGQAHAALGRHALAIEQFEQASRLAPGRSRYRTRVGLSRLALGETQAAIEAFSAAFEQQPDSTEAGMLLADTLYRAGDLQWALSVAESLSANAPEDPRFHNLVGTIQSKLGRPVDARAAFLRALKESPGHSGAKLNLARLELASGDLEQARQRCKSVLEANPEDIPALSLLAAVAQVGGDAATAAELLRKVQALAPRMLDPQLRLAELEARLGNIDAARDLSARLSDEHPDDLRPVILRARLAIAAADVVLARSLLQRAADEAGYDSGLLLQIGRLQRQTGDIDTAIWSLTKAAQAAPDSIPVAVDLTTLELQAGRLELARERAEEIARSRPEEPAGQILLGDVAMASGDPNSAATRYTRALRLAASPGLLVRWYRALVAAGREDEALVGLEKWAKANPAAHQPRILLASALARQGRTEDALAEYEALERQVPNSVLVLNNLANIYHQQRDPRAVHIARRALELAPESAAALDTLGWILVESGEPQQALRYIQDAFTRAPDSLEVRYHLAVALHRLGRDAEALRELRVLADSSGGFPQREAAAALLRSLSRRDS